MNDNGKLILSAAKLTGLGFEVDAAREKLRRLVDKGISYDSKQMRDAFLRFQSLDTKWKELEHSHLALRETLISRAGKGCTDGIGRNMP